MQLIHFFYHDRRQALKDKKKLKQFLESIFYLEKRKLESLSYIFCSDIYLLGLNENFLKHDYYTDVLTFDLSSSEEKVAGEVYLSIDRIKENAKNLGVSVNIELHRVIFHGALHLCGYKDKKKQDALVMRSKEEKYIKKYFF